jgi:benzylsuccinate CoA-transferase BbsE subunit
MLGNCKALDLTDEKGFLCGKILAELGVDVIKVEKPGGDAARNKGAFWHDIPDPEKNLYWFAYNNNKRGITLNIDDANGQHIFRELVKNADFIIESFRPGYMDSINLDYNSIKEINPGTIMVSITPFGQAGPYRDYEASDITVMAMSGLLYQTGQPDGPPVTISMPQACMHAGADAAAGAMIAYYHREATGKGQHVDVSMQQSTAYFSGNAIPFWELNRKILKRTGYYRSGVSTDTAQLQVWQCKDGFIFFNLIPGKTGEKSYKALVEWIGDKGIDNEEMKKIDWVNLDMATVTQNTIEAMTVPIKNFFLLHTKKELFEGALERNISLCPLSSMSELYNDRQLKFRDFWIDIEHDELNTTLTYPRQFVKSSELSYGTRFRAPLIGEHNQEVYKEIGLTDAQLVTLKQAGII